MKTLSIPLVGMHFRPPAKEVLSLIPLGSKLILHPEPDNQYDSNAVMVLFNMQNFPVQQISMLEALIGYGGFNIHELMENEFFPLGYLAATGGKPARGGPGNTNALMMMSVGECRSTLGSAPEGYPVVNITSDID